MTDYESTRTGATSTAGADGRSDTGRERFEDRRDEVVFLEASEARRSFATSEFYIYIIGVVALLFFTYDSAADSLSREEGWRYAIALTIGYLLSRGLAKAGSSEPRIKRRQLD